MPQGGSASVAGNAGGTNYATIFDSTTDGGQCVTFGISNRTGSAGPVYVYIPGLHSAANPMPLQPGDKWAYRAGQSHGFDSIATVQIKGDGTNPADVDYGVLAK